MKTKIFNQIGKNSDSAILQIFITKPPWRNRLARSAVNRKVGGSSPPGGEHFS